MNLVTPPNPKPASAPTKFQRKSWWSALTAVSITTLFATAVLAVFVVNNVLGFLEPVLLPVIIAAVLAYLLEPIVAWLVRRKLSRTLAVVIVMISLIAGVAGFFWKIVPDLVQQTNELVERREEIWAQTTTLVDSTLEQPIIAKFIDSQYTKSLRKLQNENVTPEEIERLAHAETPRQKLIVYLDLNSSILMSKGMSWLTSGGKAIFGLIGMVVGLVMTPIFTFYFLKESSRIKQHWHDLLPLKASHFKEEVVDTLQEINGYLISFFRGQMVVSLIDGALIAVFLKIVGLPYAITIGAACAVLGIIPYVGTIVTVIPAVLIAWASGSTVEWMADVPNWGFALVVLGIFIGVNQFDGWVIQPKIVGDSVGLHPLTVMFSVLFWTLVLGGLTGALLAVPLTAAIKVLFKRYIWQTMKKNDMKHA